MYKNIMQDFLQQNMFVCCIDFKLNPPPCFGVLFISNYQSYLTDKMAILHTTFYISLIILIPTGIINIWTLYNKMTKTTKFFRKFIFEMKKESK